jgi:glyoxylase-like metal-dependent hydrolase (beta-lactamase superfamily II)
MTVRATVAAAVTLFAVTARAAPPDTAAKPVYEVYAIRYATIADFPVSALVAGAEPSRKLDIAMTVWLLKGAGGKNVLVDTGFYRTEFLTELPVRNFTRPSEALAKVGLRPEDISDVIITHMHWDHAGGVDLFPGARVWIQKDEWSYYSDPARKGGGVAPSDVAALQKVGQDGRLHLVEGDAEVIPGITVYLGGKHTHASQYVGVNTAAGTVVVASDAVYLYENLEKGLPIAQTLDAKANLEAQQRMRSIASSLRLIVPGHDPEVFVRFPKPGHGVARIE